MTPLKKLLFFVTLTLVSAASVSAQTSTQTGNIKGRVMRSDNSKPVYNATVKIQNSQKSTRTNKDGDYSFEQLSADQDYALEMSKSPLYADGGTTVNVKANATATAPDVNLAPLDANAEIKRETIIKLQALFTFQDIDKLETQLGVLSARCKEERDQFCKDIESMSKAVEQKKMGVAERKLQQLRTNAGIGYGG